MFASKCCLLLIFTSLCASQSTSPVFQIRISTANGADSEMVVTYIMNTIKGTPAVYYGTASGVYTFSQNATEIIFQNSSSQFILKTWLKNLIPKQQYYYKVGSDLDGYSPEYDFFAPVNATVYSENIGVKFACVADIDYGATFQLYIPIITQLFSNQNGMGLSPGNIANGYSDSNWNNWGTVVEPFSSRFPFLFAPGPLDLDPTGGAYDYANRFTMPGPSPFWWSYDFSLIHIVSIASVYNYTAGSPQYIWFENDLIMANQRRSIVPWIFVMSYSAMYSGAGPDYFFRSQIEPLLHKYGVDIAIWNGYHFAQSKPIYNEIYDDSTLLVNPGTIHLLVGTGGLNLRQGCTPENWAVTNLCTYGVTNITVDTNGTLYALFRQIQIEHNFNFTKVSRRCPADCSGNGNCSQIFFKCVCFANFYGPACSIFLRDDYAIPAFNTWSYGTFSSIPNGWSNTGFNASSWITSSTPIKQFQSNFNTRDLLRNGATVLGPSFPNAPLYVRREFLVNLPSNNGSWAIEGRVFSTEVPSMVLVNNNSIPSSALPQEYYWNNMAVFNASILQNGTNVVGLIYANSINNYFDASVEVRYGCQQFYYGANCDIFIQTTGTTGTTGIVTTGSVNSALTGSNQGAQTSKLAIGLGVAGGILFLGLLIGAIVAVLLIKRSRTRREISQLITEPVSDTQLVHLSTTGELGKDWEIDFKEIEIGEELGRGAFGVVFKARWRNADCVVKQMHNELTTDRAAMNNFLKEANNMKNLRPHPNVCDLLGVCTKPGYPICIVTEFLSEGSLVDLFNVGKIAIDSSLAVTIAKDIASGMSHLHKENILHCDLAARNLLVSLKGKDQYVIKVADFGLSHISESDNYNLKAEAKFPIRWSAPEVMTRGQVSKAADVWSFGVVVWEILEWEKPYNDITSNNDVMRKVCNDGLRLQKPTRIQVPDRLWEIMQSCWESDPKKRLTFQDLYKQLGELESEMGKYQSSLVLVSSEGGEFMYARSPLDQQQPLKAVPEDHYRQSPAKGLKQQTSWKKGALDDNYKVSPAPQNEGNYKQSPHDNQGNYKVSPAPFTQTNPKSKQETGYQSVSHFDV